MSSMISTTYSGLPDAGSIVAGMMQFEGAKEFYLDPKQKV